MKNEFCEPSRNFEFLDIKVDLVLMFLSSSFEAIFRMSLTILFYLFLSLLPSSPSKFEVSEVLIYRLFPLAWLSYLFILSLFLPFRRSSLAFFRFWTFISGNIVVLYEILDFSLLFLKSDYTDPKSRSDEI